MTDFQNGILVGCIVAFVWMASACTAAAFYHFKRTKTDPIFDAQFNRRPHREGNVVAFRRR
jgi:hypothetical protein